ncbi:hypothetical protein GCM10027280_33090 [Micromonospora polyrhachis]|uniref:CopC domain-containing protein n=1 Tax=Micromonospora polyrhachis TaxID=1282883 RepID=A0A7W7WRB5_9ACTN|nr:hypothetical protein [Micromonospora polyrhachis]MBB4960905.1 hypothetical protein [Micromonospora polyrhachis]
MVHRVSRRLAGAAGLLAGLGLSFAAITPAYALPAPTSPLAGTTTATVLARTPHTGIPPAGAVAHGHVGSPESPAAVTITGPGITEPLHVRAAADVILFDAVMEQVGWMTKSTQTTSAPKSDGLGPKYTVVVLEGDVAKQTYDLYPLAEGGPRAFRPAEQPDRRKTSAAWFFGRLDMSETLRAAGAPLSEQQNQVGGGGGGVERATTDKEQAPTKDFGQVVGDLREMLLLNVGVLVLITLALAGIALLVRRRTR